MDFLFGGGGGQTSSQELNQLAAAAAAQHEHHTPSAYHHHDLDLISAASSDNGASSAAVAAAAAASATTASATATATSAIHFNGHDNGPILYDNLNRTSAIDDIRNVVIYIFISTIFLSFFLILPGIRNEKIPTFLCITSSLMVTAIIIICLNGTTWHVGEAPISAPYKAFSRDRIQGDLSVRIGLNSVNISLKAHKYYILHATNGPMIMENIQQSFSLLQRPLLMVMMSQPSSTQTTPATSSSLMNLSSKESSSSSSSGSGSSSTSGNLIGTNYNLDIKGDTGDDQERASSAPASSFIQDNESAASLSFASSSSSSSSSSNNKKQNLADELLADRSGDGGPIDSELDVEEPFSAAPPSVATSATDGLDGDKDTPTLSTRRLVRSSAQSKESGANKRTKRSHASSGASQTRYTIKRVHVDINYNERFYWIGPMQMRQEYQHALERGLPYPILTCVEYLSQDDGGFSWSRQYRAAGYYTSMLLWLSAAVCVLMFSLHCAAPKYGIYAMQLLGLLMLCTSLTYATLVPRGDQKLVIPFEGQSVTFRLGLNFWLLLVGGCLALFVGTTIVIIDKLFPNFIFTTVLDVDFDASSSETYFRKKHKILGRASRQDEDAAEAAADEDEDENRKGLSARRAAGQKEPRKPRMPPFMRESRRQSNKGTTTTTTRTTTTSLSSSNNSGLKEMSMSAIENKLRGGGGANKLARTSTSSEVAYEPTAVRHLSSSNSGDIITSRQAETTTATTTTTAAAANKSRDKRELNSREISVRL